MSSEHTLTLRDGSRWARRYDDAGEPCGADLTAPPYVLGEQAINVLQTRQLRERMLELARQRAAIRARREGRRP